MYYPSFGCLHRWLFDYLFIIAIRGLDVCRGLGIDVVTKLCGSRSADRSEVVIDKPLLVAIQELAKSETSVKISSRVKPECFGFNAEPYLNFDEKDAMYFVLVSFKNVHFIFFRLFPLFRSKVKKKPD